ncbi:MAG: phosphate propanoyltransferase [Lachnospiraceae bacterium]|nr:phosphate propanoyltransferase [Lachnospiraceae bacterium]
MLHKKTNKIPVSISARHIHLTREALDTLFGEGYELTVFRELSQPGQYASNEKLTIAGPKGSFEGVRILGPLRNACQVEISMTDARKLGVNPPVRSSGNIKDSASIILIGPCGSVMLEEGCIVAERHIHMSTADAQRYGVSDMEKVMVKVHNAKGGILDNVFVRVRDDFELDMHIDTDDANAFLIKNSDWIELMKDI